MRRLCSLRPVLHVRYALRLAAASGLLLALAGCAGAPDATATASVGPRTDSVLAPARSDAGARPAARATPPAGIGAQPLLASLWSTDMPLSPAEQDAVIAAAIASHEMRHP
jgi:hypothetical protein